MHDDTLESGLIWPGWEIPEEAAEAAVRAYYSEHSIMTQVKIHRTHGRLQRLKHCDRYFMSDCDEIDWHYHWVFIGPKQITVALLVGKIPGWSF